MLLPANACASLRKHLTRVGEGLSLWTVAGASFSFLICCSCCSCSDVVVQVRALAEQAHLPWPIFLKVTFRCRSSSSKTTSAPLVPAEKTSAESAVAAEEARGSSSALNLPELHEQRCKSLRDGAIFYVRHAFSGASGGSRASLSTPAMPPSLPLDFFVAFYKTTGAGGPGDDVVVGAAPPATTPIHSASTPDTAGSATTPPPQLLLLRRVIVVRERWGHARVRSRSGRESLRAHGAVVRWIESAGRDIPCAAEILRDPHRLHVSETWLHEAS